MLASGPRTRPSARQETVRFDLVIEDQRVARDYAFERDARCRPDRVALRHAKRGLVEWNCVASRYTAEPYERNATTFEHDRTDRVAEGLVLALHDLQQGTAGVHERELGGGVGDVEGLGWSAADGRVRSGLGRWRRGGNRRLLRIGRGRDRIRHLACCRRWHGDTRREQPGREQDDRRNENKREDSASVHLHVG